ncbi:oxidoreductase [Actinotalea ferrariae CF5-4]|uniref:Oxidoreductase n=1 Tax=Actinotalea ferrariae CF5-4 TaxID=948458 RepID=A0A021VRT5_9CELL|nr:CBS domain-containing protein [Actinotalea ferrariae]EYR61812.1 oxidoreductase [Actinotalea ferrariae CF5-4]
MARTIADVITPDPVTIEATGTVREAAELMRSGDIGDVVVVEGGSLLGIVTDRDLVVRVLAVGGSGDDPVRQACSSDLVTVSPDASLEEAAELMRQHDVRRLPVTSGEELVGIVSIGDLAIEKDPRSTLGDISAAAPNS